MILQTKPEEVIRLLPEERHVVADKSMWENKEKITTKVVYEVIVFYHLHMPSYLKEHLLNIHTYQQSYFRGWRFEIQQYSHARSKT